MRKILLFFVAAALLWSQIGAAQVGLFVTPYTPQATALFQRMTVQPDAACKTSYDATYRTPGFQEVLAKLDGLYFFGTCASTEQAALLNLAANNSAAVSGSLTFTSRQGYTSNGSPNYIGTGLNHNALTHLTQNSASAFIYSFASTGTTQLLIGVTGATDRFRISVEDGSGNASTRINDATTLAVANGGVTGLFTANRVAASGAGAKELFKAGSSLGTATTASSALLAAEITFFRNNATYTPGGAVVLSFGGFGGQLTTADISVLNNVFRTFLASVAPSQFLVTTGGQSNMGRMFIDSATVGSGDGSANSNSMTRVFKPLVQTYLNSTFASKPNVLSLTDTAFSGSSVLNIQGGDNFWWDGALGMPGDRLLNWDTAITAIANTGTVLGNLNRFHNIVIAWAQGEAEAANDNMTAPLTDWKTQTKLVWAYMRARIAALGYAGIVPIVVQPLGTNSSVDQARLAAMRAIQNVDFPAEVLNLTVAPSTIPVTRLAADDWHAVPFVITTNGYDRMATDLANTTTLLLNFLERKYRPSNDNDPAELAEVA